MDMRNLKLDTSSCLLVVYYIYPTSSLPWRDVTGNWSCFGNIFRAWSLYL